MNRSASEGSADSSEAPADRRWSVVIPVKGSADAKSRLGEALTTDARAALALAFARDTIAAASNANRVALVVVVVGSNALDSDALDSDALDSDALDSDALDSDALEIDDPDILVVGDPGEGLNAAIRLGIRAAGLRAPDDAIAVLLGDLPALRSGELDAALARASAQRRSFVPDAEGTGTSLIAAAAGNELEPMFGVGSAEAHRSAGFLPLGVDPDTGLRRDVDTLDALTAAERLGVGVHTRSVLAGIRSLEGTP